MCNKLILPCLHHTLGVGCVRFSNRFGEFAELHASGMKQLLEKGGTGVFGDGFSGQTGSNVSATSLRPDPNPTPEQPSIAPIFSDLCQQHNPTEVTGALPMVMGLKSPYTKMHSFNFQPCAGYSTGQLACLVQLRFGLDWCFYKRCSPKFVCEVSDQLGRGSNKLMLNLEVSG